MYLKKKLRGFLQRTILVIKLVICPVDDKAGKNTLLAPKC